MHNYILIVEFSYVFQFIIHYFKTEFKHHIPYATQDQKKKHVLITMPHKTSKVIFLITTNIHDNTSPFMSYYID
jgi:hypothetical protein